MFNSGTKGYAIYVLRYVTVITYLTWRLPDSALQNLAYDWRNKEVT